MDIANREVHQQLLQHLGSLRFASAVKGVLGVANYPLDLDAGAYFEPVGFAPRAAPSRSTK
ncbi:hypothetical protein OHA99_20390 [Streptomyces coelicoflavus]|uniref:hypothetical protein n=1 Tax=Streptomyces TaxID=1883 RepID=UPI0012929FBE|nr:MULTISPECIES: hypothetical protein [Streptomyces]MCX5036980.1 hypothetical protein [Streptomyces coelicoflavus]QFX83164.1 hypothetical protein GEV49_21365 [Streptomyces sp. SYP-A7193]